MLLNFLSINSWYMVCLRWNYTPQRKICIIKKWGKMLCHNKNVYSKQNKKTWTDERSAYLLVHLLNALECWSLSLSHLYSLRLNCADHWARIWLYIPMAIYIYMRNALEFLLIVNFRPELTWYTGTVPIIDTKLINLAEDWSKVRKCHAIYCNWIAERFSLIRCF